MRHSVPKLVMVMNCPKCKEQKVIKNGKTKNNKQQYYCKMCFHRFIEYYTNQEERNAKRKGNTKLTELNKKASKLRTIIRIDYLSRVSIN